MKYKLTKKQKKMLMRIIIALVLCAAAWIVSEVFKLEGIVKLLLFVIPYVVVGYDVLKTACINLIHGRVFDESFHRILLISRNESH